MGFFSLFMRIGIFYDFDRTLSEEEQQSPVIRYFMAELKKKPKDSVSSMEEYFELCNRSKDRILGWMQQFRDDSRELFGGLSNERMEKEFGPQIKLSAGLPEWFTRINYDCKNLDAEVEHHVISAGVDSLIRGTAIFPYLTSVQSGSYLEDEKGIFRINEAVNSFSKVARIKLICKGNNLHYDLPWDSYHINYQNGIVIGDGQSDIDMFRYIRQRGGISIGVFPKGDKDFFQKAKENLGNSISILAPRDYSHKSTLDIVVNKAIENIVKRKCQLDFEEVTKFCTRQMRDEERSKKIEEHLEGCEDCQRRITPVYYFE